MNICLQLTELIPSIVNRLAFRIIDGLTLLAAIPSALVLFMVRRCGMQRMRWNREMLRKVGVFPIRNHFYEPSFTITALKKPLDQPRRLTGLDLNTEGQLQLLKQFKYGSELKDVPFEKPSGSDLQYYYHNLSFTSGDGEFLYNMVRHLKPRKIIEIGCGFSTLMIQKALHRNHQENDTYQTKHLSIEPYGPEWLTRSGAKVLAQKVEEVDLETFRSLEANDILFIDSSHIIRPQGDVLFEYLEILPVLKPGVIVHVHDVFTPRDYLKDWLQENVFFWNEQYLLEAFLTQNPNWKIIGAVNYLMKDHWKALEPHCPGLAQEYSSREPGSFWMMRVNPETQRVLK